MLSECVEVYTEVPQQDCFNEAYIQEEVGQEWTENDYNNSTVYTPNAPIQQQQQFITQLPPQIDEHNVQIYDDLIESSLVSEISQGPGPDLAQWYEDPLFEQDMQEEISTIYNTAEYNGEAYEMNNYEDLDLLELFNS